MKVAFYLLLLNKIGGRKDVFPKIPVPTSDGFELIPVEDKSQPTVKKISKTKSSSVNTSVVLGFIGSHENLVEAPATGVNIKPVRDFVRTHGNISDAKWFKSEGGMLLTIFQVE